MPTRTLSRPLKPWPTLTHAEALLLAAKGDIALNGSDRSKRLPNLTLPRGPEDMARMLARMATTAEERGALPLWQKTGAL